MRIAVCDDEEKFRVQARDMIEKLTNSLDVIVDTYPDGRRLLEAFDKVPYDVLFLDIEMPGMDGIALSKKLRERNSEVHIIFLTGHVEYALEGYEVNALRYLTKPVREDKLREVLQFVMDKKNSQKQLIIKEDGEEIIISIPDILYLEAQNQYVMIYTTSGSHLIRYNITQLEKDLEGCGFFRAHRSYVVSLAKVKRLVKNDVMIETPDGEKAVPVSRSNVKPLKEALYAYVENAAF